MRLAHISGIPVEEGVRALALAGSALLYALAAALAWLRHR
jgi:hypothetical protein